MATSSKILEVFEKNASVIAKAMKIPIGLALGGAAALYFGPKIANTLMQMKMTHETSASADSLKRLELTNEAMVRELQAQAAPARPRKDSYPYV